MKKPQTPISVDFFDEKLNQADKEIAKMASDEYDYYDEEDGADSEVDIQSVEQSKMRINVSNASRIDETIECMDSEKKLKFAGMLCEYIEFNIELFS